MHLDEARLAELGLYAQPFRGDPIPLDRGMEATLNVLVQLLQSSRGVVVITGPAEAGVGNLLSHLEQRPDTGLSPLRLDGRHERTLDDIWQACIHTYGLPTAPVISGSAVMVWVRDLLDRLARTKERPALLVDHAEQLDDVTLRSLIGLQQNDGTDYLGPALLLAGEGELEDRLDRISKRSSEISPLQLFHIAPWTVDRVADYVEEELARVGGTGGPAEALLDPKDIHRKTGGAPELVQAACLQALANPVSTAPGPRPFQSIAHWGSRRANGLLTVALLLTALLGFLIIRPYETSDPLEESMTFPETPEALTERVAEEPGLSTAEDVRRRNLWRPDTVPNWGVLDHFPHAELDRGSTQQLRETHEEKGTSDMAPSLDPQMTGEDLSLIEQDTTELEIQPPQETSGGTPETDTDIDPTPALDAGPESDRHHDDGDWIATRPAGNYTIQLVAAHDRLALEGFVADRAPDLSTHLLRTRREGRDWYVVIAGDYATRDEARMALEQLPAELRTEGAWIRAFGSLQ